MKLPKKLPLFSSANQILNSLKNFLKNNFCMQKLVFCVHNVTLDTQNLIFFPFLWIAFFKNAKIVDFFYMTYL